MATVNLKPNADVTKEWNSTASDHWTEMDEGHGTPDTADHTNTTTLDAVDENGLEAAPGNLDEATEITVYVYGKITSAAQDKRIKIGLFVGAVQKGDWKYCDGTYDTDHLWTLNWTGLSLSESDVNDLRPRRIFEAIP